MAIVQVATAWAALSNGDTFTYTYSGKTLTYKVWRATSNYVQVGDGSKAALSTSASGTVTIPSTVTYGGTTYTVNRVGARAFDDCSNLTSITIPNTVTSIMNYAFDDCSSLTSVTLSSNLTSIGYGAFGYCYALTTLTLPSKVENIGNYAFRYCKSLVKVTANMTAPPTFGTDAFAGIGDCVLIVPSGKRSAYISAGWTEDVFTGGINDGSVGSTFKYTYGGVSALYYITSATNKTVSFGSGSYSAIDTGTSGTVTIPASVSSNGVTYKVTSVKPYAFQNCTKVTKISVGTNVTSIDNHAFYNCSAMGSISFAGNITKIGNYAFYYCSSLTSITLPSTLTSIDNYAFSYCSKLAAVYANMTTPFTFGTSAFSGISSTCYLKVPSGTRDAYINKGWTTSIFKGGVGSGAVGETFTYTYSGKTLTYKITQLASQNLYVQVGDGTNAAISTSASGSLTIPSTVTYLGNTYTVNKISSNAFSSCSSLTSVTIPSTVTSIGNYAFKYCGGLTSVNIPSKVTAIGDGVFYQCSGLTAITIPNSVTSIGNYAFHYCSGLTSLTIPSSVTSIGNCAFQYCSGLKSVTANMTTPFTFGTDAFKGIGSTCWLKVPSGTKAAYIDKGWTKDVFKGGVYDGSKGETFTFTYNGKTLTYLIIDATSKNVQVGDGIVHSSTTSSVAIPVSVTHPVMGTNYTVTRIGARAFSEWKDLTSVTIPSSVTSIEDWAFCECRSLTSITIPSSVTSIGIWAFNDCISLTSVTIPNGVTRIGDDTFSGCRALTSVTIPSSVTRIGDRAFDGCIGLTSLTIPSSVTHIGDQAFHYCIGLTSLTIPSSVTHIGQSAFWACSGLTSVTANMTTPFTFGSGAFSDIGSTCWLKVPSGTKSAYIDKGWTKDVFKGGVWDGRETTFTYTYNDKTLTYMITDAKNKVVQVGDGVAAAISLSTTGTVSIPSSVTHPVFGTSYAVTGIGENAFNYRQDLTSVNIPNSVTTIGHYAFWYCTGLTSVNIPSRVTSIGGYAFYGCNGLTSLTFPSSLTSIEYMAFAFCNGLQSVTANMTKPFAFSEDAFEGIGETCKLYVPTGTKAVYIANGWTTDVFKGGIYDGGVGETFTYTYNDKTLTYKITDATNKYVQVGDGTNAAISTLASGTVSIPSSVTYLGQTYRVKKIGDYAFFACGDLTSVSIPNGVTSIGDYVFHQCWNLTSVSIPNSVTSIGNYAFYICNVTSVTIPNSVTSIGNGVFSGCGNMTSITISNSVNSIGEEAFYKCSGLTSVTIPSSVTSIGEKAFMGCYGLTSINIPSSVTSIGKSAFENCSGLTSVSIPNSVNSIGESAFSGCRGLTSVSIPNSVTSIGEYAFMGCRGLTSVTAHMTSPFTFGAYAFFDIGETCKLYVPEGTKAAYIAEGWTKNVFKGGIYDGTEQKGDVNGDGGVDISDVTSLVNIILGKGGDSSFADVNGEGHVDISDVTSLVNIILGK